MAGSVTVTDQKLGYVRRIIADWIGDAANGSVPDTILPSFEGRIAELITNPGVPAPTALYDITAIGDEGEDKLQGLGADRSAAATEARPIVYAATALNPVVDASETVTLKIANQAVVSAQGRIILVITRA